MTHFYRCAQHEVHFLAHKECPKCAQDRRMDNLEDEMYTMQKMLTDAKGLFELILAELKS